MIGKASSHLGSGTASFPTNRCLIPESNVLGRLAGSSAVGTAPRKSGVIPAKPSPDMFLFVESGPSRTGPSCFNILLHGWQIGPSRCRSVYRDGNTDVGARPVVCSRECPCTKSAMRNSQRSWPTTAGKRARDRKYAGSHFLRSPLLATVEQLARPLRVPPHKRLQVVPGMAGTDHSEESADLWFAESSPSHGPQPTH